MTDQQAKPPTIDDLRDAFTPIWASAKRLIETGIATLNEAGIDVGTLGDPPPDTEPVDVATARDAVVTAALRYVAAEGDAGTSLTDTRAALAVLDDALAGYADATGWLDEPPTVPAEEALKPGNEVEFTIRGTVTEDDEGRPFVQCPNAYMAATVAVAAGSDFRIIKNGQPA